MVVTLEWIRDNYDTNKDRHIDKPEAIVAMNDLIYDGSITREQYDAVYAAYTNDTLLPEYGTTPPPSTETRTMALEEGTHTLVIRLNGYEDFKGKISVNSTSVVCMPQSGYAPCSRTGLPRLETSAWIVTAYMKAKTTTDNVCTWINSVGGSNNLQWTSHILEAYYVYIGASGHSVGFSSVTWDDVLGLYYYYIKDPVSADGKIHCGTT